MGNKFAIFDFEDSTKEFRYHNKRISKQWTIILCPIQSPSVNSKPNLAIIISKNTDSLPKIGIRSQLPHWSRSVEPNCCSQYYKHESKLQVEISLDH